MKSGPWPPNSDGDLSCLVPATRNASLQLLFKRPTPAIVFETATKSTRLAHCLRGVESIAPAMHNRIRTSKSIKSGPRPSIFNTFDFKRCFAPQPRALFNNGANMWCFHHFGFEMCFVQQPRALFEQLNFQKSSEAELFLTFSLRNLLGAAAACAFAFLQ